MKTCEMIRAAQETTRMVKVAPGAWSVDTFCAVRRAWIQGVALDWRKARKTFAECKVFQAARAAGLGPSECEAWAGTYAAQGGCWQSFARKMAREILA